LPPAADKTEGACRRRHNAVISSIRGSRHKTVAAAEETAYFVGSNTRFPEAHVRNHD
jgi:hypothetical protein